MMRTPARRLRSGLGQPNLPPPSQKIASGVSRLLALADSAGSAPPPPPLMKATPTGRHSSPNIGRSSPHSPGKGLTPGADFEKRRADAKARASSPMAANLSPQMSPQNYREARTMTAEQAQRTLAPRQLKPMHVQEYFREHKRDVTIELGGNGTLRVKDFASKTLLYKIVLPKGKVMRKGANDVQLIPCVGKVFTFCCQTGADSQIAFKAIESWTLLSEVPPQSPAKKSSTPSTPTKKNSTMSPRAEAAIKAAEDKERADAIAAVAAKKAAKARAEKKAVDDASQSRADLLNNGPDPALLEMRREMAEQKKKEKDAKQKEKDAAADYSARKQAKEVQLAKQAREDLKAEGENSPIRPKAKERPSTPTRKLDDNDPFAAKAKKALRQSNEDNKKAKAEKKASSEEKAIRRKERDEAVKEQARLEARLLPTKPEGAAAVEPTSTTTGALAEEGAAALAGERAAPAEASVAAAEERATLAEASAAPIDRKSDAKVPAGRACGCSIL